MVDSGKEKNKYNCKHVKSIIGWYALYFPIQKQYESIININNKIIYMINAYQNCYYCNHCWNNNLL